MPKVVMLIPMPKILVKSVFLLALILIGACGVTGQRCKVDVGTRPLEISVDIRFESSVPTILTDGWTLSRVLESGGSPYYEYIAPEGNVYLVTGLAIPEGLDSSSYLDQMYAEVSSECEGRDAADIANIFTSSKGAEWLEVKPLVSDGFAIIRHYADGYSTSDFFLLVKGTENLVAHFLEVAADAGVEITLE